MLNRRRFLQLLAAGGAALALPRELTLPSGVGASGQLTSAGTATTPAVYLPPREVIELADTVDLDELAERVLHRRYWALGQVPSAGDIYIGGVWIGRIREWSMDMTTQLEDDTRFSDQYQCWKPGERDYKVSAWGRYQLPADMPVNGQVKLVMRAGGATYSMLPTITRLNQLGDQFSIEAEAGSVQTKLG
jgi:hypothetical protein